MILEILAYISVGVLFIGWLVALVVSAIQQFHTWKETKKKKEC